MRQLHVKEYKEYILIMRNSVYTILPLYEKEDANLKQYVDDLYIEIENVLETIDIMPNGAWYPTTRSTLKRLRKEVVLENNKPTVRRLVLNATGLIQKQIELLGV